MMADIRLSVIVPVFRGGPAFPRALEALRASEGVDGRWELIVVQDGYDEEAASVAERLADRVLLVEEGPTGPANARNRGAEVARGDVLVFVDADVLAHADALRRILEVMDREPEVVAVFGSYDDEPESRAFISQYRNLFHRYVHLVGAGEAETFWAGCGAIRTRPFLEAGGFDAGLFPRPQIEDIELGYRLRERGGRILLDPTIQGTHLKRWTLKSVIKTDLLDRGVPWMRLLVRWSRTHSDRSGTLSVRRLEKVKTALLGLGLAVLAVGLVLAHAVVAGLGVACLAVVVAMNGPVYAWFAQRRGWIFALGVIPLNLLYYFLSGCSVILGWVAETVRPGAPALAESAEETA